LFKRLLSVVATLVTILTLALMLAPNELSSPLLYDNGSPVQVSIVDINKVANNDGVIINLNHAVNFNHINQRSVEYLLVAFLVLFFVSVVNFRNFKSAILPPPWYVILKYSSRLSISGWKVSNLLYKSKLLFQFYTCFLSCTYLLTSVQRVNLLY